LSERLQQLPQPLSARGSEAEQSPMEQNEELFQLHAEQRQELTDRQTSLVPPFSHLSRPHLIGLHGWWIGPWVARLSHISGEG